MGQMISFYSHLLELKLFKYNNHFIGINQKRLRFQLGLNRELQVVGVLCFLVVVMIDF